VNAFVENQGSFQCDGKFGQSSFQSTVSGGPLPPNIVSDDWPQGARQASDRYEAVEKELEATVFYNTADPAAGT
jgi:hypothetical protein